jgi:hypothetical protein
MPEVGLQGARVLTIIGEFKPEAWRSMCGCTLNGIFALDARR